MQIDKHILDFVDGDAGQKEGGSNPSLYVHPNSSPSVPHLIPRKNATYDKHGVPFWDHVKQRKLKVTPSLAERIADLPLTEQRKYAEIQDMTFYVTKSKRKGYWGNIHSKWLSDHIGPDYKSYRNDLVQWGEIEVNYKYSYGEQKLKVFTMSYRIPKDKQEAIWISSKPRQWRPYKDHSRVTGEYEDYIKKNIQELTVAGEPRFALDSKQYSCLSKISSGAANLSRGEIVKRLFHVLLETPRDVRHNIKHKSGKALAEFDIKTCFPFLMLTLCAPEEKARYFKFLEEHADIYIHIARESGITFYSPEQLKWREAKDFRDALKVDFARFNSGAQKNYVYRWYEKHFPSIASAVIKMGKEKVSAHFQNLEAELMMKVGLEAKMQALFYIVMHDGWIGFAEEGRALTCIVERVFKETIGYVPQVFKKLLVANPSKERVFSSLPSSPCSSYVTGVTSEEEKAKTKKALLDTAAKTLDKKPPIPPEQLRERLAEAPLKTPQSAASVYGRGSLMAWLTT